MEDKSYHQAKKYNDFIDILKLLGSKPTGFTTDTISSQLNITKTTCLSILNTMQRVGFAELQDGKYYIGTEISKLWACRTAILKSRRSSIDDQLTSMNAI